jgi:hypothetical protein
MKVYLTTAIGPFATTPQTSCQALGGYKCGIGMSVENVPVVVNIKTLKGRFTAHKFSNGWAMGVVKSGKEEESRLLASH